MRLYLSLENYPGAQMICNNFITVLFFLLQLLTPRYSAGPVGQVTHPYPTSTGIYEQKCVIFEP